jgi:hypothetical protein
MINVKERMSGKIKREGEGNERETGRQNLAYTPDIISYIIIKTVVITKYSVRR